MPGPTPPAISCGAPTTVCNLTYRRAPLRSRSRPLAAAPLRRRRPAPLAARRQRGRPAAPAPRGGPRRSPQRRPAALQDRPAPTPARQQRSSRCRPPISPTTRPRRPQPQRLAPAVMIRTLGCLPALIRPPFRCSTVPLQARARNGTTTATLRVIYPATNLGPGRATQQGGRWKRGLWWNCEPTSLPKGRGWKPSTYGCARQRSTRRWSS